MQALFLLKVNLLSYKLAQIFLVTSLLSPNHANPRLF